MTVDTEARLRRRTASSAERRAQLIAAAQEVIAELGLSGTTTLAVARRAGLSVGLISHHFGGKDGLLAATLEHLAEELQDRWLAIQADDALSPAEKLAAIIDGLFHPEIATQKKIAVWFAFFGDAGYRALYREMAGDFDTERGMAIEGLCRKLAAGRDVDAEAVATSVEALADGLWLSMMLYPDWLAPAYAHARVFELLALHFPRHFTADGLRAGASEC